MDLQLIVRFLKGFVLAAKQQNISLAANELHIPQPYLSYQIKQLEKNLGVELFNRKTRPMTLTPAGVAFLQAVEHIPEQLEQAKRIAQQAHQGDRGKLTIGMNTSISNSLLPDILRVFRSQFPQVELELQELVFKEGLRKLLDRTVDVDFENEQNLREIDKQVLVHEIIREEPLVMVVSQDHPLARKPQVRLQDLKNQPFVMPSPESVPGLYLTIEQLCQQANIDICAQTVQEATWMTTVLSLVAGGIGISLLPENVLNLKREGVVYKPMQDSANLFQLAIVWRRNNSSAVLANFLTVVREVAQKSQNHSKIDRKS